MLLMEKPAKAARLCGLTRLTDTLHGRWIREMVFGQGDMTLLAHRGSYKTTCLSFAMAVMLVVYPRKNLLFLRKTDSDVLEVLRQPLEEKRVTVSRAKYSVEYPANFTLVAAMNPCPCGYYNHPAKECVCSPGSVHRYMSRISGPLMDRIDLHVEVTPVPAAELSAAAPGEPSAAVRERVVRAREVQAARFAGTEGVHTNAMMNAAMLREYCRPDAASAALLERAMERLSLSARAYDRILKVARTIADLAGRETIAAADVAEAINYRSLDRGNWGR